MSPLETGLSPLWTGVLAILVVAVGAPLAAWIKGYVDRRMKRDDIDHASTENDEKQVRADRDAAQTREAGVRAEMATMRAEMNVLREDADRERNARIAEAEKYNAKSQTFLEDIAKARDSMRQSYNDSEDQRRAHETAMNDQRELHKKQMNEMLMQHNIDLNRRDRRIAVLTDWILSGKPPPPPAWDEEHTA